MVIVFRKFTFQQYFVAQSTKRIKSPLKNNFFFGIILKTVAFYICTLFQAVTKLDLRAFSHYLTEVVLVCYSQNLQQPALLQTEFYRQPSHNQSYLNFQMVDESYLPVF